MTDRLPPNSIETEEAFLGSCLIDKSAIEAGLDIGLKPEDFYRNVHQGTWKAIVKVYDDKKHVDVVSVSDEVDRLGFMPEGQYAGSFLAGLVNHSVSFFHAPTYAILIRDKAIRRRLIGAANEVAALAYSENQDIETLMDQSDLAIRKVKSRVPQAGKEPDPDAIIERLENVKQTGLPTRLPALNAMAKMTRGHIWVIGGFSSTGKSAVLCNFVEDVLLKQGSVMIASTEMSQEQYMLRLLAVNSNVPQRVIRNGGMQMEQGVDYRTARDFYKASRIRIYDDLYNFSRISRKAKQVKEEIGLDVLFVDYIQNINETGDEVKDARVVSIQLQALAKELDICVVALSQLSNSMAQQMNSEGLGNFYAFKGSGAIKDVADLAIMLDRDRQNRPDVMWFNVVKNRHDGIGKFGAWFDLETGLLRPMTNEEMMNADPNSGRRSKRATPASAITAAGNNDEPFEDEL